MAQQVKILGILHIVFGALCVLGGLITLAVMGGIAGIVGSADQSNDAAVAVPVLAAIGLFVCVLCLVVGLPGLVGGIGLLQYQPWARITIIVISALDLIHIPIGTALGIYGFWVLLNPQTEAMFKRPAMPAMPQQRA
ncbi:MAG TPA: hypothetical protein VGP62_24240 [Bryobacteraceae bacterium]|jgi:hypothetical protein|nr:hypothetical protein [Bryobacteraceae bacterium]